MKFLLMPAQRFGERQHLNINARDERATKLKPCSPNSSNRSGCAECDYGGGGTSPSSSTSRQRLKI
jgi:hypothetical protein